MLMYYIIAVLVCIILFLVWFIMKYQRQIKDICRQLWFLKDHDSNMMISSEIRFGGVGYLADTLNEIVELRKWERKKYLDKEKSISDIYTNLSHDIRTPLTSLDGYFQLLKESEITEEQQHYILVIQERISSLKDMLEELFTFTKLQNDDYVLELSTCSLNRILKDTLFSYYDIWKENDIEPKFEITEEPLMIEGNPQALGRTIRNIIKNGFEHGEKQFEVHLKRKEQGAVLSLKNMVSEPDKIDISRIFERFYKADEARSDSSTGLGLSIAKEFVLRMKGEIRAEMDGNWFCVIIELPLTEQSDG